MPDKGGRSRIERAALDLFACRGIASTSTREIARRAGLSEGALYRHYVSKDTLARALFQEAASRLLERLEAVRKRAERPDREIRSMVETFFRFADEHPSEWEFLMHAHPPVGTLTEGIRLPKDAVVDAVRRGTRLGVFTVRDPVLGAAFVIGLTLRSVFFFKQGLLKRSERFVSRETAQAALRALGTRTLKRR